MKEDKENNVNNNSDNNDNNNSKSNLEGEWMIRPCEVYDDEYSDCTSIKARFHQYFIFGKTLDCSQWSRDYTCCKKWIDNQDVAAAKELIRSERCRRLKRLRNHYANDVWEKRTSPPEDWNKPLPEHMLKEYEHSYLNIKAKEMRGETKVPENSYSFCSIS